MENNITEWIRESSDEGLHIMINNFRCEHCPGYEFCKNNIRPTYAEVFREWSLKEE